MPHPFALLHTAARVEWTAWTIHWSTVVGLLAFVGLYEWGLRREPGAGSGEPEERQPGSRLPASGSRVASGTQRALFYAGCVLIFLSLNGPLHDLSDSFLFSAHMVQHLVITLVVPPLLLAGTPGALLRPALRHRAIGAVARHLTSPFSSFFYFNVTLAAWHLPVLYNLALAHHPVHIAEHLMFMATAVLMWWPLLSPLPELPRLAYPGQMLYCFLMVIPMSIVAIYITMADSILYPAYASAPRVWGITPMSDQQIGGLIMWIPGGLFFLGVMAVIFFKWAAANSDTIEGAQVSAR